MYLVLDQGVPADAAFLLRERGIECVHVVEIGMSRSGDGEILSWTREKQGIVVTLDADFHAILATTGAGRPSVIRLRMQGLDADAVARLVQNVLDSFEASLKAGALVTIKANKITCHRLPVGTD